MEATYYFNGNLLWHRTGSGISSGTIVDLILYNPMTCSILKAKFGVCVGYDIDVLSMMFFCSV